MYRLYNRTGNKINDNNRENQYEYAETEHGYTQRLNNPHKFLDRSWNNNNPTGCLHYGIRTYFAYPFEFIEADGRLVGFQRHFFKRSDRTQTIIGLRFFAMIGHLFYKTEIRMRDNVSRSAEYTTVTVFTDGNIIYLVWQYTGFYRCEKNADHRPVIVIDGNCKYKYQFFIQTGYNRFFDKWFTLCSNLEISSVGNIDYFPRVCMASAAHVA